MIHIYCGDGKGKTTAALGLAVRFAGSGRRVYVLQFLKGAPSCELAILARIPEITVQRNSRDFGFSFVMTPAQKEEAAQMHNRHLKQAVGACRDGAYGMLVLDECLGALSAGLLDGSFLRDFLYNKPSDLEVVLTGRNPPADLLELADYVSEMKKRKHPFDQGVPARIGVEK